MPPAEQQHDSLPVGAVFVSPGDHPVNEQGDPAAYFRTEFDVDEGLVSAILHVTALGVVEPYLNGRVVGDEVLEPGWTSYRHRLVVRAHDVTAELIRGRNAFGAIVGEGWALGRLGYEAIAHRRQYADRLALFAVIQLTYADRTVHISTGEGFRCGEGSVQANGIYDGVTIDARLEPHGWAEVGFDDRSWSAVEPVEWDLSTMVTPIAPPIRRIEELEAVEIWTMPTGTTAIDFGQNISGWVRIRLDGPAGTEVTVRHAEVLVDGVPDYVNLRTAEATDRYILAGDGPTTFEPRFTFHGFRWAEVSGLDRPLTADDVRAVVVHTDMVRTGWFETSDPMVNRLHDNVVWSMRDNFVGVPTDCPQRDERMGWTGDLNAFAPTAAFLYDVSDTLESWLCDLRAEQRELGRVPYVVPDVHQKDDPETALWSDVAVSLPWALYMAYGDEEILRRSYESMAAFTTGVEKRLDERGLWSRGFQFGDWLDPDAPMHNPLRGKTEPHLVASAYFHKVAREMAQTAQVLGNDTDGIRFTALADRVRRGFQNEYVTPDGRLANESATAYALAIEFGLLDANQLDRAGTRLVQLVRAAKYKISTGFAGTPVVAHAMTTVGHTDVAYRMLTQTEMPSFLYPITQGATTIWERWDSVRPDGTINPSGMTSLNHYALGAVASWLHQIVGGLRPLTPGYKTIAIAPHPGGGLTHATVELDTARGRAGCRWELAGEEITIEATVPDSSTAVVTLPRHPEGEMHEVGAGIWTWTYVAAETVRQLSIDSSVDDLAEDVAVWSAIADVFRREVNAIPPEVLQEWANGAPMSEFLDNLPIPDHVRNEIDHTITELR